MYDAKVIGISFSNRADLGVENTPGVNVAVEGHFTDAASKAHSVCSEILDGHGAWRIVDVKYEPGFLGSDSVLTVSARVRGPHV
jgi:hypothetical protein